MGKKSNTNSDLAVDASRLVSRLYEESQDEPKCLYWQAAEMLEKFLDNAICWQCKVGDETFTTLDRQVAEEWSDDYEVTPILLTNKH